MNHKGYLDRFMVGWYYNTHSIKIHAVFFYLHTVLEASESVKCNDLL